MPESIGQRQLRNDNAEIMRRVEAGESFVITRNTDDFAGMDRIVEVVAVS